MSRAPLTRREFLLCAGAALASLGAAVPPALPPCGLPAGAAPREKGSAMEPARPSATALRPAPPIDREPHGEVRSAHFALG